MRFFLTTVFLSLNCLGFSQAMQKGFPFVKNYLPADYQAESQNWAIVQNNEGLMYFGNTKGILEFDGLNWRLIDPVNIDAFVKTEDGKIYACGNQNYGYLSTDPKGKVFFESLTHLLSDSVSDLNGFYSMTKKANKIYFAEHNGRLHIYDGKRIEVVPLFNKNFRIKNIRNQLYISSKDGFFKYKNKHIEKIDHSQCIEGKIIIGMFEFNGRILLVSRNNGLFIYADNQLIPWNLESGNLLKKNQVYRATKVNDTLMAFGTVEDGVFVMNHQGQIAYHVNTKSGMANHDHCAIYTDNRGNIWSGLENGISHIQINSPFTFYDEQHGLNNAAIYDIHYLDNKLYLATAQGIMISDNLLNTNFFYVQNNKNRRVLNLFSTGEQIITGYSNKGTYQIQDKQARLISEKHTAKKINIDTSGNYLICIREHGGLVIFHKEHQQWTFQNTLELQYMFEHLLFDEKQAIWWATINSHGIAKISFNNDFSKVSTVDFKPGTQNLSPKAVPFKIDHEVFFSSSDGIFNYSTEEKKLIKNDSLSAKLNGITVTKSVNTHSENTIILGIEKEKETLSILSKSPDHLLQFQIKNALQKISPFEIKTMYLSEDNSLLIGCVDRLISYNLNFSALQKDTMKTQIRSVEIIKPEDSTIFYGSINHKQIDTTPEIHFIHNALRFKYALPFFDKPEKTVYSYRLIGYHDKWSAWTTKAEKEYSYLKKGKYRFEVKAKNIYGTESPVTRYAFVVEAPWYSNALAYTLYAILLIVFSWLIVRISIRRVARENEKLESTVTERTREISRQKDEILIQKDELAMQHQEISLHRQKMLDSLNYAQQIQSSLLTAQEKFQQHFQNHFVLYKPKDIVSGDFYWMREHDNEIFFAGADCTGHGVPGAFMSVLGISLLNDIINQNHTKQPSGILEKLRTQLIQSLRQESAENKSEDYIETYLNSKVRDGIDIALCKYNKASKTIVYSGANLPALLLRNNDIIELIPTDNPIGVYLNKLDFFDTSVQLQPGDCLYLFSDGYFDQFGGSENKKYYYSNFKRLLQRIHKLPMAEQQQILTNTIENWQGIHEQIDDIMVLGFKF